MLFSLAGKGQDCKIELSGRVFDQDTQEGLPFASIYLQESRQGTVSDSLGYFRISGICPGDYHIVFSHIGCESLSLFLSLKKDTLIQAKLDHHQHVLQEITLESEREAFETQSQSKIGKSEIESKASQSLGQQLERLPGVEIIQNGEGVAKPMVHGLTGNRLLILNQGVPLVGQQWGQDHAPEIDPVTGNELRVIKGVGAVEYLGSTLGSVVSLEPGVIVQEPHLHGKARYEFQSNGRGHGLLLKLQKRPKKFGWRFTANLKRSGDNHSPDYFLNNTGQALGSFALHSVYVLKDWSFKANLSSFINEIGILRGAHISNLTDLESAFTQETPYFTEEDFSYVLDAPRQWVAHHTFSVSGKYIPQERHEINVKYALQLNSRKEFDVRRSGRTDIPALFLKQTSQFIEAKHAYYFSENLRLSSGIQHQYILNTNQPETGILPLIPDYVSNKMGIFSKIAYDHNDLAVSLGGRGDFEAQNIASISNSIPREIIRYQNQFFGFQAMAGGSKRFGESIELGLNFGLAQRNPAVNELYSQGLHQGVSGIEEGNPDLKPETGQKISFDLVYEKEHDWSVQVSPYHQIIDDYIYLNPTGETRLTIRGAFPVYAYEQTRARIMGFDLTSGFGLGETWHGNFSYSFLKGQDLSENQPLIYMPANRALLSLNKEVQSIFGFKHLEIEGRIKHVFKQNHLNPDQDFLPSPDAYTLCGISFSADRKMGKGDLKVNLEVSNLFNVKYRDYLNRLRYFSDEIGRNFRIGVQYSF